MARVAEQGQCSETVAARGLGRLLSGLPQIKPCAGRPVVTFKGKPLCARHALRVRQYLAAHGDPASVVWLDAEE